MVEERARVEAERARLAAEEEARRIAAEAAEAERLRIEKEFKEREQMMKKGWVV